MLAERLEKAWRARRRSTAIDTVMRFSDHGLTLGAGTLLIKSLIGRRSLSVDPSEPRLMALLAAAHNRRPSAEALAHLSKAAERWSEGDEALAAMHLALSQLDTLRDPEADAYRLFLADRLLTSGFEASVLIGAVGGDRPAPEPFLKYDADQPRVPAGSGRTSGEWTSGGGSADDSQGEGEVNPRTITDVSTSIQASLSVSSAKACAAAQAACVDLALHESEIGEPDNDNWPAKDLAKCRWAGAICKVMSWLVQDVPGIRGGGVIFPDKGVVVMHEGQVDRYYPRRWSDVGPNLKRSF